MSNVRILNPLGAALLHYTREISYVLGELGCEVEVENVIEPSAHGNRFGRRIVWALSYLREVRRTSRSDDILICLWPPFGYWDTLLLGLSRASRTVLIVHDPEPLSGEVGYGVIARFIARTVGRRVELIVHGSRALDVVCEKHSLPRAVVVSHPMLEPKRRSRAGTEADAQHQKVVRVVGQFKAERNLDALEEVAACGDPDWRREVIGRGWPDVNGWQVRSEFVTESEFESLIAGADVVLVPYKRFFQSGVAVRALELLTPVVGPRVESMAELLGGDCTWLATEGTWASSVGDALECAEPEIYERSVDAYVSAVGSWKLWLVGSDKVSSQARWPDQ